MCSFGKMVSHSFVACDILDLLLQIIGVDVEEVSLQSLLMFLLCLFDVNFQSYSVGVRCVRLKGSFLGPLHLSRYSSWGKISLCLFEFTTSTHLLINAITVDMYSLRLMWFLGWQNF